MADALDWARDGASWPHHGMSRFVRAAGIDWHVQIMGEGPVLLLLHGTGASTHSWRDVAPLLARDFTVIAPDLPGHAFTRGATDDHLSLPGMATALGSLLDELGMRPEVAAGHSAGAAILLRMALNSGITPKLIVSFNGALLPFGGIAGQIFSPLAKLLFVNPFVPRLFAWRADMGAVRRLVEGTGSKIDPLGLDLYARLMKSPAHAAGALGMMANWDLKPLERDMVRIEPQVVLVAGGGDLAISPETSFRAREKIPHSVVEYLRGLGHLAHEEAPGEAAALISRWAREKGVLREQAISR